MKIMKPSFQDYLKNCAWMGGDFGYPGADVVVSLLQAYQVGNAGVAQAVARYEAKKQRRAELGLGIEDYDSDDSYPAILEEEEEWYPWDMAVKKVNVLDEEEWYPFERAGKKVTPEATPHLAVQRLCADHAQAV